MNFVTIRTSFRGIHCWPEAPSSVIHLSHPHRHTFHVEVDIAVGHSNRDVEFLLLQDALDTFIQNKYPRYQYFNHTFHLSTRSCEQVCADIVSYLEQHEKYGQGILRVYVDEDGENGATVTKDLE